MKVSQGTKFLLYNVAIPLTLFLSNLSPAQSASEYTMIDEFSLEVVNVRFISILCRFINKHSVINLISGREHI